MQTTYLQAIHTPLIIKEVPTPKPGPGQVLIRLSHSSLNHRDVWIQQGQYAGLKADLILGSDGCGTVAETGSGVDAEWIGKEVIINPGQNWGPDPRASARDFKILGNPDPGTFAEYVVTDARYIYTKPAHLSSAEAAAIPLGGLTTYRAVFTKAQVRAGEKVLITGIGAGTALIAFRFAQAAGAEVYVTSGSPEKLEKARALGAKGGYNYKDATWYSQAKDETRGGFDVIIDSASGKGFGSLVEAAKAGGRIAFFGGTDGTIGNLVPAKIFWRNLSILGTTMGTEQEFEAMLAFTEKHGIKPVIDTIYPSLHQAQEAFDYMASGKQFGKIVLTNGI